MPKPSKPKLSVSRPCSWPAMSPWQPCYRACTCVPEKKENEKWYLNEQRQAAAWVFRGTSSFRATAHGKQPGYYCLSTWRREAFSHKNRHHLSQKKLSTPPGDITEISPIDFSVSRVCYKDVSHTNAKD